MSTAEYERLEEVRQELVGIHNILLTFQVVVVMALAWYLYRELGVSIHHG